MERRLAAILAADVVGYSKAMAEDESGTLARLKAHRANLFDPKVSEHNGRIIKLMGDGTLVAFASVVNAVKCAIAIQSAEENDDSSIQLRIGINLGDVIMDGDDIYGDGVNVAARLEALARPGGICVSDMVYQNINTKLDAVFEEMGSQNLKNISRPVPAWQWRGKTSVHKALEVSRPLALPDRPSIAVLPFNNTSGDPDQEYFSDGIAEDIITELSRFRELFVIARNSSFSYKGKSAKIQEIATDLGVAYILEGSVRKAGNRVRITAQLIEASSGSHIWAERYDRDMQDIFDLQDEITQTIVTLLPVKLHGALVETARRKPSDDLSAYDFYLRGRWLYDQTTGQDSSALELLKQAVKIDPECAQAHAYIALAHAYSLYTVNRVGENPAIPAIEHVEQALSFGEGDHFIHAAAGYVYILAGSHDLADANSSKAVELNRNDIFAMLIRGYVVSYLGDPAAGVAQLNDALRYDPHTPYYFYEQCAEANYMLRDYERAIEIYNRWQNPPAHMHILLAVNYAQSGQMDKANAAMAAFGEKHPEIFDYTSFSSTHVRMCKRAKDAEHWLDGYRKVGLVN